MRRGDVDRKRDGALVGGNGNAAENDSAPVEHVHAAVDDIDYRAELAGPMRQFIRMYRPHAAREDTVLFPAFRDVVTPKEFDELGDRFEDKEQELFGKDGFEKMVGQVAAIEESMGIYSLSSFTPADKTGTT